MTTTRTAWHKVVRLSLPSNFLATTNRGNLVEQGKLLWAMTTGDRRTRRVAQARLNQMAARAKREQAEVAKAA